MVSKAESEAQIGYISRVNCMKEASVPKNLLDPFSRCDTIPACDKQTDRQTGRHRHRAMTSIASCG